MVCMHVEQVDRTRQAACLSVCLNVPSDDEVQLVLTAHGLQTGKYYIDLHKSEIQKYASVKSVASIINQVCAATSSSVNYIPHARMGNLLKFSRQLSYNNKGLMAAMIVGGWDEKEGGQVFSNPIGGTLVQVPWAVEGSGSSYIWSYFDDEYKTGMTKEETEKFIVQGIALAMARDGSSGGVIRLVTVDKEGAKKQVFQGEDIPLAYEDMPEPSVPQQVVW